jgi:hypothetical protein
MSFGEEVQNDIVATQSQVRLSPGWFLSASNPDGAVILFALTCSSSLKYGQVTGSTTQNVSKFMVIIYLIIQNRPPELCVLHVYNGDYTHVCDYTWDRFTTNSSLPLI